VNIPGTRRVVLAAAAAIALSTFGTALAAVPAAQASGPTRPVIISCVNQAEMKPTTFIIACADGNDYLKSLSWSTWIYDLATGKGIDRINDCVPACFDGKFHNYPAKVELWRVEPRPHHAGQTYFTRMTLTYTGKIPKGFHKVRTIDLWAKGA
jgi:hypothetical protein